MKRFQFRLERVLRFRRTELDEAKAVVARERTVLAQLEAERKALEDAHDQQGGIEGTCSSQDLALRSLFGDGTRLRLVRLDELIGLQHRRIEESIAVYVKRQQAVRVLEKLRERNREEYLKEVSRKEIAELDEFGVLMRQRSRHGK
jgi:flagellar export protein FliJ